MNQLIAGGAVIIGGSGIALSMALAWWVGKGSRAARVVATVALVVGTLGCAWLTWRVSNPGPSGMNLVPGATLRHQWAMLSGPMRGIALFNLIGNLAFLVPVAVLLRAVTRWHVLWVVLAGLVFATVLELGQFVVGRSTDIDDVLVNTVGAALGAGLGALVVRRPSTRA